MAGKDGQITYDEAINAARQAMEDPEMKKKMAQWAHKAWEANDGVESVEGDKPEGDKPEGDRPEGDKPEGDKPEGDRPESDKPKGDKPKGDKPSPA